MGHLRLSSTDHAEATAGPPSLTQIASLERQELIDRLLHFDGSCRLDFTADYLAGKSTDKLRHILLAACQCVAKRHS